MSGTSWKKSRLPLKWAEGFQILGSAPVQEDYFEINPDQGLFIMADGFGGSAGKKAAELSVKSVRKFLEREAGDLDATLPFELRSYYSLAGNVLYNAISFSNQKLMETLQEVPVMERGGASVMAAYLEGRLLAIANVGACRLHLLREGRVHELVRPRTLERQVNPFDEDSDTAIPLMSFGTVRQLEPEITEIELRPGDRLFFGTSGLKKDVRDQLFPLSSNQEFSHQVDEIRKNRSFAGNLSGVMIAF